jgi:hypothetical protein
MKKPVLITLLLSAPLHATTILIDFGTTNVTTPTPITYVTPGNWNNLTSTSTSGNIPNLKDTDGNNTGIKIAVSQAFDGVNTSHTAGGGNVPTLAPTTASVDAFYANGADEGQFTLTGLNPAYTYSFRFFASLFRASGDTASRTTAYTVGGQTVELNPLNNFETWSSSISGISPDLDGSLIVDVGHGTGNGSGNFLIGIMEITYTIPEPSSALLLAPAGLLALRRRRAALP